MRVTTETGSYYEIADGFWSKNGGPKQKLIYAYCFESWEGMSIEDVPFQRSLDGEDKRLPIQVGKRMRIGNIEDWWISTKIVSIEGEQDDYLLH